MSDEAEGVFTNNSPDSVSKTLKIVNAGDATAEPQGCIHFRRPHPFWWWCKPVRFADGGDRNINLQNQIAPLQTAQVSQEVLLNLYCNEEKPSKITPLDLALTSYLILRKAFDHEINDSQSTLALRLCADYKAIRRSLDRLDELGWITYRDKGDGLSKGISLNIAKLPAAQPVRDRITPDAERLVDFYIELRKSIRKKLPRNWRQQQLPSAQRLLTRYGDYEKASQVVHALFNHEHPGIQTKARRSLHNLLNTIPKARRLQQQERHRAALDEVASATEVAFSNKTNEGKAA